MPERQALLRTERGLLIASACLGAIVGLLAILLPKALTLSADDPNPEEVWEFVQHVAAHEGLDPGFVYAIIHAESSLNPRAKSNVARGMMQLTRGAWETVSDEPYRRAWNWRTNIEVGIAYLAYCRNRLQRADQFSYAMLAAAYRYGPNHVRNRGYDFSQINQPRNRIYIELFSGNTRPIPPPGAS